MNNEQLGGRELSLELQARRAVQQYGMLTPGDTIIIGLSGGADSVALLHWLCSLREEFSLQLSAAHVNHCLRGEESDEDERFCRALCQQLSLRIHVNNIDISALSRAQGIGLEEAGRQARYAFLASLGCGKIALAHTLSDRAETFLMNIARGAALRGLCSIPPVRGTIIRPLIECSRQQVEAYCGAHALNFRRDSSNLDLTFRRNAVRHQQLPQLGWRPEALRRMFRSLEADEAYLAQLAAGLGDEELFEAAAPLKNRALRQRLVEQGREPSAARMAELEKQLRARKPALSAAEPEKTLFIEHFDENFTENLLLIQKEDLANCLDYDTIVGEARPGRRQPGDRMHLCNGAGTKPFKQLCQEHGIPPGRRETLLLLRDDAGLVWIEGMGCAHRCRVTEQTRRVARVYLNETPPNP